MEDASEGMDTGIFALRAIAIRPPDTLCGRLPGQPFSSSSSPNLGHDLLHPFHTTHNVNSVRHSFLKYCWVLSRRSRFAKFRATLSRLVVTWETGRLILSNPKPSANCCNVRAVKALMCSSG